MAKELTVDAALLELLDHLGEEVAIGIMLPGRVPWAGGHGTLSHAAQRLRDEAQNPEARLNLSERDLREQAERLLLLKDWGGHFLVDNFTIPLDADHVVSACRTEGLPNPGLDFTVGLLTVRVTFTEHDNEEA